MSVFRGGSRSERAVKSRASQERESEWVCASVCRGGSRSERAHLIQGLPKRETVRARERKCEQERESASKRE